MSRTTAHEPPWGPPSAKAFATWAHLGQQDKAGKDYIGHPARVAEQHLPGFVAYQKLSGEQQVVAQMVAYLHDVLEDTLVDHQMLGKIFGTVVTDRVMTLTRGIELPEAYYHRVQADPITLVVKAADIRDNTDRRRLTLLDHDVQQRLLIKYHRACLALGLDPETTMDLQMAR